jgi:hypothetical protein
MVKLSEAVFGYPPQEAPAQLRFTEDQNPVLTTLRTPSAGTFTSERSHQGASQLYQNHQGKLLRLLTPVTWLGSRLALQVTSRIAPRTPLSPRGRGCRGSLQSSSLWTRASNPVPPSVPSIYPRPKLAPHAPPSDLPARALLSPLLRIIAPARTRVSPLPSGPARPGPAHSAPRPSAAPARPPQTVVRVHAATRDARAVAAAATTEVCRQPLHPAAAGNPTGRARSAGRARPAWSRLDSSAPFRLSTPPTVRVLTSACGGGWVGRCAGRRRPGLSRRYAGRSRSLPAAGPFDTPPR